MKTFLLNLMVSLFLFSGCQEGQQQNEQKQTKNQTENQAHSAKSSNLVQYGIDTSHTKPDGIKVGNKAPLFEASDDKGMTLNLEELVKEGPVVLMFYRGQWCPVCNQYLKRFEDSLDMIQELGAKVIAVTPETPPNVQKMREKSGTSVTIIPDTTERIMEQYGVKFKVTSQYAQKIEQGFDVSIAENNNAESARLPVPATYLINQNGRIAWRFFNPNYKQRASANRILTELNQL